MGRLIAGKKHRHFCGFETTSIKGWRDHLATCTAPRPMPSAKVRQVGTIAAMLGVPLKIPRGGK